jgi:hypothetical protein
MVTLDTNFTDVNHNDCMPLTHIEWIDIANTEYRYTAIRIPLYTGIPVFLTFFLSQTELLTVEKNQVVLTKY